MINSKVLQMHNSEKQTSVKGVKEVWKILEKVRIYKIREPSPDLLALFSITQNEDFCHWQ